MGYDKLSRDAARVAIGFARLSPPDQHESFSMIHRFLEATPHEQEKLREELQIMASVDLGPVGGDACPCCGRTK